MFNPFKYLKTNKQFKYELHEMKEMLEYTKLDLKELKEKATPEIVIEKLLKKKLTYYDIDSKKMNERVDYYESAQMILKSEVYKNEFNGIVKDIIEHIAQRSQSHEETQGLRMSINYGKLIDDRLKNIKDPRGLTPTKDNLYSTI